MGNLLACAAILAPVYVVPSISKVGCTSFDKSFEHTTVDWELDS